MIEWFTEHGLGAWGRWLLDLYRDNALVINLVVVAYGVVLVVWHVRLRPYRRAALEQAMEIIDAVEGRAAQRGRRPREEPQLQAEIAKRMDWPRIAAIGERRLVAGRWGLWPRRVTAESLPQIIPIRDLCRDALSERAAGSARP